MRLARSRTTRLVVAVAAVVAFALLHERFARPPRDNVTGELSPEEDPSITAGTRLNFTATAYCKGDVTSSGTRPRSGVAAADPRLLPVGSVVHVQTPDDQHAGIYTILDTGPNVRGSRIDLYMWSCFDASGFGRKPVEVTVMRRGWDPAESTTPSGAGPPPTRGSSTQPDP